jgi:hypothetical protein
MLNSYCTILSDRQDMLRMSEPKWSFRGTSAVTTRMILTRIVIRSSRIRNKKQIQEQAQPRRVLARMLDGRSHPSVHDQRSLYAFIVITYMEIGTVLFVQYISTLV